MKLVLQFPTRNRPDKFFDTLTKYRELADDWASITTYVICNADDKKMNSPEVHDRLLTLCALSDLVIHYAAIPSKIAACNWKIASYEWDIVILVSDDMIPLVQGWDTRIKQDMLNYYPDTDGVLWYNDGHKKDTLLTLSILGRKYFNRFGYLYAPEYKSFFCDNEFMEVAKLLGKVTYFPDCIIEHQHPDYNLTPADELYKFNLRYHGYDAKLYAERKAKGFNLK